MKISPVKIEERKNLDLRSGDTVRVHQKITEKDKSGKAKTRIQIFEGITLSRKHGSEAGGTFTVRKVVDGIGVERIFPLYSPNIEKIEIIRRSNTRRSKLYFVREKAVKEMKKRMKMAMIKIGTDEKVVDVTEEAELVSGE